MKTIEDLDSGTTRRIDWQELLPGVLLFRALVQAFRLGPILSGTFIIFLAMFTMGKFPPTLDFLVILFRSRVYPLIPCPRAFGFGIFLFLVSVSFLWLFLARRGAFRLVTTERVPLGQGLRFSFDRLFSFLLSFSVPLSILVIGLIALRYCGAHPGFFTLGTPVCLVWAILLVAIAVGTLLGIPLMAAAVAVDNCDGYDAFSRASAFIVQRPFYLLTYLVPTVLFGAVGYFVLRGGVFLTSALCDIINATGVGTDSLISDNLWSLFWWTGLVILPYGFLCGYICYAGLALYLILRKNLYGVAFDRIFRESDNGEIHRLRPILRDEAGAPEIVPDDPTESIAPTEPAKEPTEAGEAREGA